MRQTISAIPPHSPPLRFSFSKQSKERKESFFSGSVALKVVIVLLGVAAVVGFAVFLFRILQKKKREEQHARLLKLFEDDNELVVELGIRD